MRFILGFVFYGILFYLIFLFFPDAFHTLVSWVAAAVEWIKEASLAIWAKINAATSGHA